MINNIGKITIYVNDQAEAKKFWIEKLNFIVKFEQQMGPSMTWLEVGPSQEEFTTLVLYDKKMMQNQNPNVSVAHPSVMLSTKDIQKTYDQMRENGVVTGELQVMPYGKNFTFKDQDGNDFFVRED